MLHWIILSQIYIHLWSNSIYLYIRFSGKSRPLHEKIET